MEQVVVQVKGLHCMSCVARLERALRRVDGVHRSKVDLPRETVDLAYGPGVLDEKQISSVIEDTGFEVTSWTSR